MISDMQKELDESKLENETLDLIYACASCEKCQILDAKNSVLKNKMAKFTYSSQNLDTLLASSKNVVFLVTHPVCLRTHGQHWYLNNGCSRHVTGDKPKFLELSIKEKGYITYGDNNQ
ncbi:hypothetical protein Lal_00033818 [Lupinus albus]|nr:hypothetical protein Lal_00033818 [Lupinus albus]